MVKRCSLTPRILIDLPLLPAGSAVSGLYLASFAMGGAVSLNGDYSEADLDVAKTISIFIQFPEPHPKQIELKLEDRLDVTIAYLKSVDSVNSPILRHAPSAVHSLPRQHRDIPTSALTAELLCSVRSCRSTLAQPPPYGRSRHPPLFSLQASPGAAHQKALRDLPPQYANLAQGVVA